MQEIFKVKFDNLKEASYTTTKNLLAFHLNLTPNKTMFNKTTTSTILQKSGLKSRLFCEQSLFVCMSSLQFSVQRTCNICHIDITEKCNAGVNTFMKHSEFHSKF